MIQHFITYFIARGLPGLINFLAIIIYSRILPPEQYGTYAIVLASISLINSILLSWLRLGVLRYYPSYTTEERKLFLSTVFIAFLAYMLLSGGIISCIALFGIIAEEYSSIWLLGLCLLWVSGWFEINLEIFRAELSPKSYGWFYLSKTILALVISIGIIFSFHLGMTALVIGSILAMFIPLLFVIPKVWSGVNFHYFNRNILKTLLAYGLPLTLTLTMGFLIDSSDRLLLGWLSGPSSTGLYAVTYDFAQQTIILIMTIVNLASYPIIIHTLENGDQVEVQKQLEKSFVLLFLLAFPTVCALIILSPNISFLFFGTDYQAAAIVVIPWIALVSLIQGIKAFYLDLAFQLSKQTIKQVFPVVIGAALNILLNLWWIPLYQIKGAIMATLIAYVVSSIMSWWLGRRYFVLPIPKREIWKIVIITVVMFCALYPIHHLKGFIALIVQIGVGIIVYGLGIWVFNVLNIRKALPLAERNLKIKVKG
ncbi:oligosaccharide flippase family protein [Bacillus sp. FJAT-52991]|uniref:Oligosaccharide flippase family protein n=1 Tax=Bacillus kandeliae TaxID=3129297 RepID=A0ABZ2N8A4_9BACI